MFAGSHYHNRLTIYTFADHVQSTVYYVCRIQPAMAGIGINLFYLLYSMTVMTMMNMFLLGPIMTTV